MVLLIHCVIDLLTNHPANKLAPPSESTHFEHTEYLRYALHHECAQALDLHTGVTVLLDVQPFLGAL